MNAETKLALMKTMIKKHEGWRSKPYLDTEGVLTIGYGFNIEQGISRREGDALLDIKLEGTLADLLMFEEYSHLSDERQIVIINMIYNLGLNRVKKFKKMRKAIREHDWDKAALEMLNSKWAKQVGKRAQELAKIMKTGEI